MILAIQQPEHLPWLGFFNKMMQCDKYVYLDNVQFKRRYFENRNRIKIKDGSKWLTVPVINKGRFTQKINEVLIDNSISWKRKYKGTLEQAYLNFPFWNDVKNIVFPSLENGYDRLLDLNLDLINRLRDYLGINTQSVLASTLAVDHLKGGELILEICLKNKASAYVSGPEGKNYLNNDDFLKNDIRVYYHDYVHPTYPQKYGEFLPYMSVIDLIAQCGPESGEIIQKSYRLNTNE